jgi:RNA polymerase sigma-70 factor (ECF subfamily)
MLAMAVGMALVDESPDLAGEGDASDLEERARERRLVELAARGDALAFREIVERHHRGIHAFALRFLRDATEAEDVAQETFARAFCAIDRFDPAYRLSTWLYGIALNLCRDLWKRARVRERRGTVAVAAWTDVDESALPDVHVAARRRAMRVWEVMEQMRPSYREILLLKDMQELSYEEIHAITGAPITALKIRAIRAREQLKKRLGGEP